MSSTEPQQHQSPLGNLVILGFADVENPDSPTATSPLLVAMDPISGFLFLIGDLLDPDNPTEAASEAAIKALPTVTIEEEGLECSICLEESRIGGEAKEMACQHRFHSGCVEKWLRVNGSCPVCRYKMPVEEEFGNDMKSDELNREGGGTESRGMRELRIRFANGEMVIDEVNL